MTLTKTNLWTLNASEVKSIINILGINDPNIKTKKATIEKFKKITCDKKADGYFSRGSAQRLSYNKPSPTLVPGHSSFQIHPEKHRSITVREGALITSFPNNYKFKGNHSDRCMQIGNAIPPNMAYHLAMKCKSYLK